MLDSPSHPLKRFGQFLIDWPFLHKGWIHWTHDPEMLSNSLMVEGDGSMLFKKTDPLWRIHWKQIILKTDLKTPYYPVFFTQDKDGGIIECSRHLLSLKTQVFSMRVGPQTFGVTLISIDGSYVKPYVCSSCTGHGDGISLLFTDLQVKRFSEQMVSFRKGPIVQI